MAFSLRVKIALLAAVIGVFAAVYKVLDLRQSVRGSEARRLTLPATP